MWIAVFDFCLLSLLGAFFLYGLQQWDLVLAEPEEPINREIEEQILPKPGRFVALWILIGGLAAAAFLQDLMSLIS